MLHAISDGDGTLAFKNDMPGVSAEELATDLSKIKSSVRELIEASEDMRYDLIFEGGDTHAWITELGCTADNGSFESFISSMLANEYTFSDMTVTYQTADKRFEVKYDEYFKLNGNVVDTDYARYENDYVVDGVVDRKAEVIELSFNGKTLRLNYKEGKREY